MFRNKELIRFTGVFIITTALFTVCGFMINVVSGILIILSSAVLWTAFFIFTNIRYRKLKELSGQIDRILHNENYLTLDRFEEGELSILHSEISKMTSRIREQNDALIKDKIYLADSLADIAHQLRTPLTSVNLVLSLLTKTTDEKEIKSFSREAEDLLVRMDWLISSLLKLSRLDAGVVEFKNEIISVRELIQSSLLTLTIPMELRNIDLNISIPEYANIQGDAGWLAQAIQNILKNCMESVGENGKIDILCEVNMLFIKLYIHDSGDGFFAEDIPYLFDRFYRGKNSQASGYGIGLALSKMIITNLNGTIKAENDKKGGALFSIQFPKMTDLSP
ncbi:MAG: HAMP domain-containing histidine kinase [Lachnoclostridium sp.]|nr:HAMP domain-containing histidine kinase [Lachnoclostridium sp.]